MEGGGRATWERVMLSKDGVVGEDGDGGGWMTGLVLTECVLVKGDAGVKLITKFQTWVNCWTVLVVVFLPEKGIQKGQQVWCGKDRSVCLCWISDDVHGKPTRLEMAYWKLEMQVCWELWVRREMKRQATMGSPGRWWERTGPKMKSGESSSLNYRLEKKPLIWFS